MQPSVFYNTSEKENRSEEETSASRCQEHTDRDVRVKRLFAGVLKWRKVGRCPPETLSIRAVTASASASFLLKTPNSSIRWVKIYDYKQKRPKLESFLVFSVRTSEVFRTLRSICSGFNPLVTFLHRFLAFPANFQSFESVIPTLRVLECAPTLCCHTSQSVLS